MAAVIETWKSKGRRALDAGDVRDVYIQFCGKAGLKPLSPRAFRDMLTELDLYCFLRSRVFSRGRQGRSREVKLELSEELLNRIYGTLLSGFRLQ